MALGQEIYETAKPAIKERDSRTAEGFSGGAQLRFEIEFGERYLSRRMDDEAVRAIVRERLGALGITDPKQAGRAGGDVMTTREGQVEAAHVERIAEELLGGAR